MPAYTAEQVAAAIAEPRVGDVWRKGRKERAVTRVNIYGWPICNETPVGETGWWLLTLKPQNWAKYTANATLVHRAGEADNA